MHRLSLIFLLSTASIAWAGREGFNGRWVIEPLGENKGRVMWLEISGAGTESITGFMVGGGPGGQLDAVRDARIEGRQLKFHVERVFEEDGRPALRTPVTAALRGGLLHGAAARKQGTVLWLGRRAPVLADRDDGSWKEAAPVDLFDGTGMREWHALRTGGAGGWYVAGSVLKNKKRADVLASNRTFWNFRLQVEYLAHPGANSGIGLRGRYELQILDDYGQPASDHGNAALYGRIAPTRNASRPAGEWQSLDVRLIGRDLTVMLNGVTVIDGKTIDGFTAMAMDWREGQPGPITLQGDHGAVEFRKIVVTPLAQ